MRTDKIRDTQGSRGNQKVTERCEEVTKGDKGGDKNKGVTKG